MQVALSTNPNNFLVDLEKELKAKLSIVSKLKEEFWAMKFHNKNTTFYHISVIVRRRINHISCLKNRMGIVILQTSSESILRISSLLVVPMLSVLPGTLPFGIRVSGIRMS